VGLKAPGEDWTLLQCDIWTKEDRGAQQKIMLLGGPGTVFWLQQSLTRDLHSWTSCLAMVTLILSSIKWKTNYLAILLKDDKKNSGYWGITRERTQLRSQ
jgi:hypothetical protein